MSITQLQCSGTYVSMPFVVRITAPDNKHRLKVGEPGFPVAAAERRRKVIVCAGTTFEVGDHVFTNFSITPSVSLIVDIPDDIQDSWYRGQVLVGFKDAAFEASSPF